MPGFIIEGKGGPGPRNVLETRRKHRWVFEAFGTNAPSNDALLVLQRAQRPKHSYEEATMHHNQEEAYFAGKTKWEPITLGFYDAEQNPNCSLEMWTWINAAVQPTVASANVNTPTGYKRDGTLKMLNGVGIANEQWKLHGIWPKETNWMDLDYTSSEIMMVEVVMRFDRAIRENVGN